jgi:predicted DNA-binding transcriptional regulator YafY
MLETSARLLRLLSLLQVRRDWTGADLAGRLGVDVRTVRRDVDKLRSLGYPVNATPGATGGYQLGAGAELPPLLLDDDEAVAVAVGLRTAANGTVSGIEETSVRALTKLEQVLPSRLRRRVSALSAHTTTLAPFGPTVDAETLTTIAGASRDHQAIRFRYRARDAEAAPRHVEPHGMVHTGRRWYLVAWDLDRDDWRTFRLDRIDGEPTLAARFTPREPPHEDLAVYISRQVTSVVYRHQAKLVMHAPLAAVQERTSPTSAALEAIDEHSCLMTTGAERLDVLAIHLGVMGFDFDVLEPPELREHLRAMGARLTRAAGAE